MFYKKGGFPEEGEIVLCTVKKILYHSVFVNLDEYENKEGIIHISEISPGRIRNIRDFVKENKTIVCKVLRTNKEKNQLDLSLRRVSLSVMKNKLEEVKQEKKSEKILGILAEKTKTPLEKVQEEIGLKIIEKYTLLAPFFQEVIQNNQVIKELKLPEKTEKILLGIIKEKIKLPEVILKRKIKLQSYEPNGVEIIKKTLSDVQTLAQKKGYNIKISYVTAPMYEMTITSPDYKEAETELKELTEIITETMKKNNSFGEVLK